MSTTYKTKHSIGASRPDGWPERLVQFIEDSADRQFKWGDFDCSQFCIQAETAIYQQTRWADLIGGYKTERGANSRIKKAGADSLWDLIDSRMDRYPSAKMAKRGDWVGHYTESGESLGIMLERHFVCVRVDAGLSIEPLSDAVIAWRC